MPVHGGGGGDIFINKSNLNGSVAVCLAKETVLEPDSPTSMEGHFFVGRASWNAKGTQPNPRDINVQLKANMILALCHQFYNTLANTKTHQIQQRLGEVNELSGYGVTFGCSTTLEVYKLVMKFDSNTCHYYKHFSYPASPAMGHYLNGALSYNIITRAYKRREGMQLETSEFTCGRENVHECPCNRFLLIECRQKCSWR